MSILKSTGEITDFWRTLTSFRWSSGSTLGFSRGPYRLPFFDAYFISAVIENAFDEAEYAFLYAAALGDFNDRVVRHRIERTLDANWQS